MDQVHRRDDEFAEIALRIVVALYDAGSSRPTVQPGAVYRPAARYTGPDDALKVMAEMLGRQVRGRLTATGLSSAELSPALRARLDEVDDRGAPWIAAVREVLAEASAPRLGHAMEVRDRLYG